MVAPGGLRDCPAVIERGLSGANVAGGTCHRNRLHHTTSKFQTHLVLYGSALLHIAGASGVLQRP